MTTVDNATAHFEEKGVIVIDAYMNDAQRTSLEHLEEVAIEVGAEEVEEVRTECFASLKAFFIVDNGRRCWRCILYNMLSARSAAHLW